MKDAILGLHHITAIAGDAQRNVDFYTRVLGLRLVKKTVNFDDPGTYHFYYGNETGEPGTILTFFPWKNVRQGSNGTGMATSVGYAIPPGSIEFWKNRFINYGIETKQEKRFGNNIISFTDPDGLHLELVEYGPDERQPWKQEGIEEAVAIRGFHSATLTLKDKKATEDILLNIFGYQSDQQEENRYRYITKAINTANIIDVFEDPKQGPGLNAGGTNHHIAFRVADEDVLMTFRKRILDAGQSITEKIDRNYFYSLYFREPGGVLFEIATDNPGFMADETKEQLGTSLKLPAQFEQHRAAIEKVLPVIH